MAVRKVLVIWYVERIYGREGMGKIWGIWCGCGVG